MREFIGFLFFFLTVSLIVIMVFVVPVTLIEIYQCKSYGEVTGAETEYAGFACYVKHEELGWLSSSEWDKVRVAGRSQLEIKEVE